MFDFDHGLVSCRLCVRWCVCMYSLVLSKPAELLGVNHQITC